ncbi:LytTR family DNA-binding domain-containing protein [Paenibacillus sp. FSL R7-0297]|uniref:LytR/AlgR family response regulator transcription factor n=1 Tax=unclassified Paenibacillus TaxID=185978 RepID=UPI000693F420|nr:LytTR family DNA-binding domain-containing protein [Paenibacillus sp. FSL R5-0912]
MLYGGICDDESEVYEELSQFFTHFERDFNCKFSLTYFSSGEELLEHYQSKKPPHLHFLFLDIEMSGINGLETAKQIRSFPNKEVAILFLSSYPEYVMESFEVFTFQYLLKPLVYSTFESKMRRLYDHLNSAVKYSIILKEEQGENIIPLSEVISILKVKHSLAQNKLNIITTDGNFSVTGTISSYSVKLGAPFLRIYRSIIVNMDYIRKFTVHSVVLSNDQELPISRAHSKQIKDSYTQYMAGKYIP